ncbi:MAG: DUF362 domain-containing protein [Microgenomates group bacterium]
MDNLEILSKDNIEKAIGGLNIQGDIVLVKPNWVSAFKGGFTDAKTIELLLQTIKKKVIFIESYTFWRTDKKLETKEDYFSSREATFETGKVHHEFFRKMDKWFLDYTGIGEVLKQYGAEYLCITDELWNGKETDFSKIQNIVEETYNPVLEKDLYSYIPKKLFDLRGSDLISFAKIKLDSSYGASLSIKNLFGLIPDPNRYVKYHGENETHLIKNIVDINKIYKSLFKVHYVNESLFENCFMNWDTEESEPRIGNGYILAGNNGAEVDATTLKDLGANFENALSGLTDLYSKEIGNK